MQTTSAAWQAALTGAWRVETKAVVGGVEYPVAVPDSDTPSPTLACRLTHALFTRDRLIGNACTAVLEMSFFPTVKPPEMATIQLYARLVAGDGTATEWLPQRTLYIDERKDGYHGQLDVVAYDRLIFAEADYFPDGVITPPWPRAATTVVSEICTRLGVQLDARSVIPADLMVPVPMGMTMRDVLRSIAAACGGNWTMTAAGALRLVPLPLPTEACFDVGLICSSYERLHDAITPGRATLALDEETGYTAGSGGYEVVGDCYFADAALAELALSNLQGRSFVPFEARSCRLDPAVELGDRTEVAGDGSILGTITLDLGAAYLADIGAPITSEVAHEIPYKSQAQKLIERKTRQIKTEIRIDLDRITSTVDGLDGAFSKLEQTVDGFTFKTAQGETKILGSVIDTGSLNLSGRITFSDLDVALYGEIQKIENIEDVPDYIRKTYIDSVEIRSPTIKGNDISVYGSFQTIGRGGVSTGFMGAAYGLDAAGNRTNGVAISSDYNSAYDLGDNYVIVTDGGVRMQAGTHDITVTQSGCYADGTKINAGGGTVTAVWG